MVAQAGCFVTKKEAEQFATLFAQGLYAGWVAQQARQVDDDIAVNAVVLDEVEQAVCSLRRRGFVENTGQ